MKCIKFDRKSLYFPHSGRPMDSPTAMTMHIQITQTKTFLLAWNACAQHERLGPVKVSACPNQTNGKINLHSDKHRWQRQIDVNVFSIDHFEDKPSKKGSRLALPLFQRRATKWESIGPGIFMYFHEHKLPPFLGDLGGIYVLLPMLTTRSFSFW